PRHEPSTSRLLDVGLVLRVLDDPDQRDDEPDQRDREEHHAVQSSADYLCPKWCARGSALTTSASLAIRRASRPSVSSSSTIRFSLRSTRSNRPRARISGSPRTIAR